MRKLLLLTATLMASAPAFGQQSATPAAASSCPAPNGMTPAAFIDTIGVNIHLGEPNAYSNLSEVESALAYLGGPGVVTIRDSTAAPTADLMALGKLGYKLDIYAAYNAGQNNTAATAINALKPLVSAGYVRMIEGPLEVDNSGWGLINNGTTYTALNGTTYSGWQAAVAWQKDLYSTFSGQTQIALFSLADPSDGAVNSAAVQAASSLGTTLGAISNIGNVHFYEHNGNPPSTEMPGVISQETAYTPGEGFAITESGFNDSPLGAAQGYDGNQTENATYTTQLVTDAAGAGSTLTDIYELFDESDQVNSFEGHWGLFNADGSPKPAAVALHNMIQACVAAETPTVAMAPAPGAPVTVQSTAAPVTMTPQNTLPSDASVAQQEIATAQALSTEANPNIGLIQSLLTDAANRLAVSEN